MDQTPSPVPAQPQRGASAGLSPTKSCLAALVVAFLFGCGGLLVGMVMGGAAAAGDPTVGLREVLVDGEAGAEKKIAAIPIQGMIMESMGAGPGTVSQVRKTLRLLEEDDSVVGVLLMIDTPGGGVTASDRIYHDLLEFKKESGLPVHSLFLDVAASGGYYVAMASDRITAHPTTITGSIGVISQFFNVSEAMDKVGVSVNVVKSLNDEGEVSFKDIGSPYRPMRPEERELLQGLITEMWERFTEVVAAGREGKLTADEVRELADGRVFTGSQALERKLVDAVGYDEDAYRAIREAAGHEDAKIVSYRKEPGLRELFGLGLSTTDLGSSQLEMARRLLSGRAGFLYLWTAGGG